MAKLKIYTFPDPVLAQKASPIDSIEERHHQLANDMLETMYDAPGIGLAANQVGVLERMIVVDVSYDVEEIEAGANLNDLEASAADSSLRKLVNKKPLVMLNPRILETEGSIAIEEGCLSVPDYTAEVDRSRKIKVEYKDLDGNTKVMEAEELLAICIQHEIDHLNGKLFIIKSLPFR